LAELGDCGEKAEDGWKKVECCWTQTDFAELVGTTREWTNALLHQLETEGRIRRKEGWVFVRVPTRRVKPL
jgi:hypothetical protein